MPNTMSVVDDVWLLEFTGVTTTKQSHLLATTNKFVDKDIRVTAVASAGAYSADSSASTNSTVTPKISNLHASATNTYGFVTSLPSGVTATNGTNYLLIDPDATATAWSVTPRAKIDTAGYLATGSKNGSAVSKTPTIAAGTSYYIPIVGGGQSDGVTLAGGGLSATTNTNTVSTAPKVEVKPSGSFFNGTNPTTYGVVTTAPSGGTDGTTYLTIDATGTPTNGTASSSVVVTRAAITYSNGAGVIAAHNGAASNLGALDSSTVTKDATITPTVTDSFEPRYIPIVGVSKGNSEGALTVTTHTNDVTTAPTVTISSSGTFKSSTDYGVTTSKPSGTDGTNYLTIDGSAAKTNGTVISTMNVSRAAVRYTNSAGVIAAHTNQQLVAAGSTGEQTKSASVVVTVTDNFAPLYIPIRTVSQGTTTVSGTTATRGTVSWSAGAIAAGSIAAATFANVATANVTYVDISGTTAAPVLKSGDYLYINKGYVDNLKISLAQLVPDGASASLTGAYILKGYSAYDNAGALIAGTIETYDGTYT